MHTLKPEPQKKIKEITDSKRWSTTGSPQLPGPQTKKPYIQVLKPYIQVLKPYIQVLKTYIQVLQPYIQTLHANAAMVKMQATECKQQNERQRRDNRLAFGANQQMGEDWGVKDLLDLHILTAALIRVPTKYLAVWQRELFIQVNLGAYLPAPEIGVGVVA